MVETLWATTVWAYSSTLERGNTFEFRSRKRTGISAGFTFRKVGGVGIPGGRRRRAAAIAVCTSWAAASMERSRANCRVIWVLSWPLLEVIDSKPGMVANWRSSGMAIAAAMVSGPAPGKPALTWMVGNSTLGRLLTGRRL